MFLIPGDTLGPKFWTPWAHKCYTRSNSKLDYLGHSGPRLLGSPWGASVIALVQIFVIEGRNCLFSEVSAWEHCCCSSSPSTRTAWLIVVNWSFLGLNQCTDRKNTNSQISDQRRALLLVLLGPWNKYIENIQKFSLLATCCSSTQTAWLILDKFSDVWSKKRLKYRQQTIDGTSGKKLTSRNTKGCLCERKNFRGMKSHQIYLALNVDSFSSKEW